MGLNPLEIAACELATGDLRSEDLPAIAIAALAAGVDSPTLGELAAQSRSDVRDSMDLFLEVLDELGITVPEHGPASWARIRTVATGIADGTVPATAGAHQISNWSHEVEDAGDLTIFTGLTSILEDHPEDRVDIEAMIVEEAEAVLARPRPRVWIRLMATADANSALARLTVSGWTSIDPQDLPLGEALRAEVQAWRAEHTAVLSEWPRRGGFGSIAHAEQFVEAGRALVARLQSSLGPGHHVEYMPEAIRPPGVRLRHQRPGLRGWLLTTAARPARHQQEARGPSGP